MQAISALSAYCKQIEIQGRKGTIHGSLFSWKLADPDVAEAERRALVAMGLGTTAILTGDSDPTLWIKMLLGYDIIFTTASLLLFDVVFHAE